MPVMDEFREERAAIKQGTFKQKYQYFKDYYRTPLIIAVLSLALIGVLLYNFMTRKDYAFYAALINCSPYPENEWFADDYASVAGIDTDREAICFDTSLYYVLDSMDQDSLITVQKLDTLVLSGTLDVMLGGGDEFAHYANPLLFTDLREVLTKEQLEKYEPYLYYVDGAEFDMEGTFPVAIYVDSSKKLNDAYYFRNAENGIALGIYANSSHKEYAVSLIDYLME